MVEVLRKSKATADKKVTVTCSFPGCGARLRFKKSEGRFVVDRRDGDAYKFECPECGHDTWIAASIVERG